MKNYKKNKIIILFIISILTMVSCGMKLDVPKEYIMSTSALRDSLVKNDTSLVLFFTDWCSASKYRVENHYKPLSKEINEGRINLNLIMLASDANVTMADIDKLRSLGITCFYIEAPGSNAIVNRISIKKFIETAFPDSEVARIQGFQYAIPVEMLITKDLFIINEKETGKSSDFVAKKLNLDRKNMFK